jgi:signal transduction histidine kinase
VLGAARGRTILLSRMERGDTFGEMAFFEGRPRSATVRTRDACVVLEIEGRALRRLAEARPDVQLELLLTVSERLRGKNDQLLALHLKAAEAASRAKDEILATLGHELRTPLGVISSAIRVLNARADLDESASRLGAIIERQTRHLARLVEDLLDVSQLVAGKLSLERRREDLRALAARVLDAFGQLGRASRHAISLEGEPLWAEVDPVRLEQVVTNLVDNALKYTPPGGRIELRVGREGREAVLRVRDTGVGIPPEVLPIVFEPFVQASSRRAPVSAGGLGLGLTLVKRLVELHGGTVSAASAGRDRGSEFVVRLPASDS